MSTLTGEIRKLADDGAFAAFSPDGRQVAFITGQYDQLWLMGSKGEHARRLASASDGGGFINLSWSPDASRVAVLQVAGTDFRASTIEAFDVRGGAPAVILAEPRVSAMVWNADGRLMYAQQAAPPQRESYGLWELAVDPATARPSGRPRQVGSWLAQSVESLSASRDGQRVLMTRGRTHSNVFIGRLNAALTELSGVSPLTQDDRVNWPSAWTNDGRAVLFHSDRNGEFDLFQQAASQREAQGVLLGADEVRSARLSPDGRWILYLALVEDATVRPAATIRLMRMPSAGGPSEQVLETSGNWGRGDSVVSVDGDYFWSYPEFRCAAMARPAPCVIGEASGMSETIFSAFDPVRGRQGEVARVKAAAPFLAWDLSPDGTRLVYGSFAYFASPAAPLHVLSLADKATREIPLPNRSSAGSVAWSASGNAVFTANFSVRGGTLLSVDLAGRTHVLRDLAGKGLYMADPRPSPDGTQLAFGQATLASNAWLLETRRH